MAEELAAAGQPSADFTPAVAKLFESRITEKSDISEMTFLFRLFGVACFPRGELVAVAGKAKSGKTFFLSLLMAAGRFNGNGNANPSEKGDGDIYQMPLERIREEPLRVLWYDTEQSQQSTQDILVNRIGKMVEGSASEGASSASQEALQNLYAFNVRMASWDERLRMFMDVVAYLKPDLVVLDGVRDLLSDINDGREAQAMTERLMQLAQQHKCCIVCVLHQNKSGADNTMRGWIGTELTNKVFEVYNCEKLRDRTFKVEQTMTRKYDIGRQLYYRVDEDTQLPVACSHPACDQPRDEQGRWVCQNAITVDLHKLFATAMEGSSRKPFNELMAVALKKCGVVDPRTYYSYLDEAQAQDIIRIEVHPATGKKWVTLTDGQLPF
jgi:ABC-type lipoprotein export system ATPase subunit